jgi:hypothetical protein
MRMPTGNQPPKLPPDESPEDGIRPMAAGPADAGNIHLEAVGNPEAGVFRMALSRNFGPELGWLGRDDHNWAVIVTDPNQACLMRRYDYKGQTYYVLSGGDINNRLTIQWLSVSDNQRVGFYNWDDARGWSWQGQLLRSDYDNRYLSVNSENMTEVRTTGVLLKVTPISPYTGPIRHLFVLLMENRSFDHMLGLSDITGKDAVTNGDRRINGLKGDESNEYGNHTYKIIKARTGARPRTQATSFGISSSSSAGTPVPDTLPVRHTRLLITAVLPPTMLT